MCIHGLGRTLICREAVKVCDSAGFAINAISLAQFFHRQI